MNWIQLTTPHQLEEIANSEGYHVIFKHSTRCSISMMARKRFELDGDSLPDDVPLYFLDLIAYREISNAIAEKFQVHHESPQILLIRNGQCIYEASHGEISAEDLLEQID